MHPIFERLKERKLVQWVLAYLATAWLVWQVLDVLGERWGLTPGVGRTIDVVLIVGFFIALVVAWYHGEKGHQRVSGAEVMIITGLLAATAALLTFSGISSGAAGEFTLAEVRSAADLRGGRPAIAVLPFANMSADAENEFFAQGIHDDILTQLSKIRALDVIARTSVLQYADTDTPIPEIASELGVATVVEGGVQRAGDRVRINVQLIEGATDTHLWAETYDRELTAENVFSIQSDVAVRIAEALRTTLSSEEDSRIARAPTSSLTAYDYFLRGREAYAPYTPEGNEEAIRLFQQALAIDPDYARAWAGLGDAYGQRTQRFGYPQSWLDSAMVASQRAVDLDPDLPDGHKALGLVHDLRRELQTALSHYMRAIELDPSYLTAVSNIGAIHFYHGDFDQYHYWQRRSFSLSPNGDFRRTQVAWSFWQLEDYPQAEQWAREALALGLNEVEALSVLAAVANSRGDHDRAREYHERRVELSPENPDTWAPLAWTELFAGNAAAARSAAERAMELAPDGLFFHYHFLGSALGLALVRTGDVELGTAQLGQMLTTMQARAEVDESWQSMWEVAALHAALGDDESAIEWATRTYEERGYRFPRLIRVSSMFDGVRGDPRFEALLQRMTDDVDAWRVQIERQETAAGLR